MIELFMYSEIKKFGRFLRGLFDSSHRVDCYYEGFDKNWGDLHKGTFEGFEVEKRIHHCRSGVDDCSLGEWFCSFGGV